MEASRILIVFLAEKNNTILQACALTNTHKCTYTHMHKPERIHARYTNVFVRTEMD